MSTGTQPPMVTAEQVEKWFGRTQVLKGIDLEVAEKEVCCIIGPSGSGKSTFLRCINHLEVVDAGRLSVAGELIGYRQRGDKLHEMRERRWPGSGRTSAWCSSASTCSPT